MTRVPRTRGIALALTGVACAALLLRGSVATALVTRGDDVLHAGDAGGAIRAYARAAWIDARSAPAADRLAFALLLRRGPGDANRAFDVASGALRASPHDATLLADRALAGARLGRWGDAQSDFAAAALATRDPRYAHFAARMAARSGDTRGERTALQRALALDPSYAPARVLLGRMRR